MYVGVDLAERFSAAVALGDAGEVCFEWSADFGKAAKPPDPRLHLQAVAAWAAEMESVVAGATYGVEDIHPFAVNPKPALRVQGVFLHCMYAAGCQDVRLVKVSDWQRHHGYKKVKGTTSKGWAKAKCAELGYVPGQMMPDGGSGGKETVDLRDAFLIAEYLRRLDRGEGGAVH